MLSFGTAGLRGIMGPGIGCMNVYTVRYATQGLANMIIAKGGQIGGASEEGSGVAIAHDSRNNSRLFAEEAAAAQAEGKVVRFPTWARFAAVTSVSSVQPRTAT